VGFVHDGTRSGFVQKPSAMGHRGPRLADYPLRRSFCPIGLYKPKPWSERSRSEKWDLRRSRYPPAPSGPKAHEAAAKRKLDSKRVTGSHVGIRRGTVFSGRLSPQMFPGGRPRSGPVAWDIGPRAIPRRSPNVPPGPNESPVGARRHRWGRPSPAPVRGPRGRQNPLSTPPRFRKR